MNNKHLHPDSLELYSFWWSEARLLIAALALFLGGVPPIYMLLPSAATGGLVKLGLTLAWVISGAAAAYLAYRWHTGGQKVFGGKDTKDLAAFFVMIVSGFNLGITGLVGTNIGMSISSNRVVFAIVGVLYLAAAYWLWKRRNEHHGKLF
jgi:hypothetical protein